jgi:hypothetical protein
MYSIYIYIYIYIYILYIYSVDENKSCMRVDESSDRI